MHLGEIGQAERLVFTRHIPDLAAHHAIDAGGAAECLNEPKPCLGIKTGVLCQRLKGQSL